MPYKDPAAQREYQRLRAAKRRASWFADKRCVDCGSVERLELDHIDPALKVDHRIWQWSQKRIDEETAKCEVRCHACHKERTRKQASKPLQHGTHGAYSRHGEDGCRCKLCVSAHAEYNRQWRLKRSESVV